MGLVIIDKAKCTGCGNCAVNCPYRAIIMEDGIAEYSLNSCFLCGQCQAVCPEDAVELPGLPRDLGLTTMEELYNAETSRKISGSELVRLMRSRRSCRRYRDKTVSLEKLFDLVKIGTTAPSGTNSQGWNFVILPSRDDLMRFGGMVGDYYRKLNKLAKNPFLRAVLKIVHGDSLGRYYRNYYPSVTDALREWDGAGKDRLFHGAVAAIMVTGKKDASCPSEDALLATQNILLAAEAMGIGSCLIGFAVEALRRTPKIRRQMQIPDDEEVFSVIVLGHPAVTYFRPTVRRVVVPRILRLAEKE